jgi:hypothetical protein
MRLVGVGLIIVAGCLAVLVFVLAARHEMELIMGLLIASVAGFQILAAVMVLRNRKYIGLAAATLAANHAVCAECMGVFNVHDMIAHAGAYVCASCKPLFLQRLKEGAIDKETKPGTGARLPVVIIAVCVMVIILLLWFMYFNWDSPGKISR